MADDNREEPRPDGKKLRKAKRLLPNKVEFYRIHHLGYSRIEFVDAMRGMGSCFQISQETLKNVERHDRASDKTKTKIFNAMNNLLKSAGLPPVTREYLFTPD